MSILNMRRTNFQTPDSLVVWTQRACKRLTRTSRFRKTYVPFQIHAKGQGGTYATIPRSHIWDAMAQYGKKLWKTCEHERMR